MLFKGKKYSWAKAALQVAKEECLTLCCCGGSFCCPLLGWAGRRKVFSEVVRGEGNCLLLSNMHATTHSYRQKGYITFTFRCPSVEKGAFPM